MRGYRIADEEDAEDEAILRQFESLSIEPSRFGGPPKLALQRKRRRVLLYMMAGGAALAVVALIVLLSVRAAVGGSSSDWMCPGDAMPGRAPGTVTFFVIGDWGRQGISPQKKVAKMMANVADCMPPAFIISTGDNFYTHGLKSSSDSQIKNSFTDVYSYSQLQVPWYATLGNHDYGDGIDPEKVTDCAANSLSACPEGCCYSAVWQQTGRINDARWHLQNGSYAVPTGAQGLLDIFMVDTNPMIPRYRDETWYNNAGGIWQQDAEATKSQLRGYLKSSGAVWKVVVGHHPIASFGSHCDFRMANDCQQMAWLEPELQRAGVAAYMSGHEHDLQHIVRLSNPDDDSSEPVWPQHVTSGAGSETRDGEKKCYKGKHGYSLEYMSGDSGFVAVQVSPTDLVMHYYVSSRSTPAHTVRLKAKEGQDLVPRQGMAIPAPATIQRVQTAAPPPAPAPTPAAVFTTAAVPGAKAAPQPAAPKAAAAVPVTAAISAASAAAVSDTAATAATAVTAPKAAAAPTSAAAATAATSLKAATAPTAAPARPVQPTLVTVERAAAGPTTQQALAQTAPAAGPKAAAATKQQAAAQPGGVQPVTPQQVAAKQPVTAAQPVVQPAVQSAVQPPGAAAGGAAGAGGHLSQPLAVTSSAAAAAAAAAGPAVVVPARSG